MDEELSQQLRSLMQDLRYLEEMKKCEFQFFDKSEEKRGPVSDVVPVTGLIIGRFHRLENVRNIREFSHLLGIENSCGTLEQSSQYVTYSYVQ